MNREKGKETDRQIRQGIRLDSLDTSDRLDISDRLERLDRQAGKQAGRQADRQADRHTGRQADIREGEEKT